jgi:hypothetical protein
VVTLTDAERFRPLEFYERRKGELRTEVDDIKDRVSRHTFWLILCALLACFILYRAIFAKQRRWLWVAVPLVPLSAWIVERRHRLHHVSVELSNVNDYYDQATARLGRQWDALDGGDEFADADHLYSRDLDLFGHGSIYQLLCSAQTQIGRETLSDWMKFPAALEEIHARQQAVAELRIRRDLPESIAAVAPTEGSDFDPKFLKSWVARASSRFPKWAPVVAFALPIMLIAVPILYGLGFVPLPALLRAVELLLLAEVVFGSFFRSRVKSVLDSLPALSVELSTMRELLRVLEQEQFSSAKLKTLRDWLGRTGAAAASGRIRQLLRFITLVRQRDNEFFLYPSLCLLWATQFAMAIERWRCRYGTQMTEWMASLGVLEALISLSTYSYEHPGDPFPEVVGAGPIFEAAGIGHPLLNESTCVRNDLELGDRVQFLIVSGSNMSGKSTFLRAIGLNAVLAYMGAPVRCAKLRLSILAIGAAVRIQDSVVGGRSHFQAEMERLRKMIEAAERERFLFLADEIMAGTNSHDRRIATEWVVRAFLLRGAIGAISTHDLALTQIATNGLPGENVHFEDSGESGVLSFDYKLRPGMVTRSNALNIARMLGIDAAAQRKS